MNVVCSGFCSVCKFKKKILSHFVYIIVYNIICLSDLIEKYHILITILQHHHSSDIISDIIILVTSSVTSSF